MTSSTITCEAFDAALPDYLEGTLDEKRLAAVDGHLSECVRCTSLVRDLANISKDARALPDLVPSRDLWEGIEARIAAPVIPLAARAERKRRIAPAWMGIAAAALVVSTAGVTYVLTARSIRPASGLVAVVNAPATPPVSTAGASGSAEPSVGEAGGPTTNASATTTTAEPTSRPATRAPSERQTSAAAQFAAADQAHSDAVYDREIEMLQTIVSQRKTGLDSSTVAIIEKNLRIIDAAIQQSRAALVRDPASRLLGQQLTHALDKKVELLRTAALLPAST
jgi:Putative zinc-finger